MPEPSRRARLLVPLLAAVLLLAGCGGAASSAPGVDEDGRHGTVLDDPYRMPDVTLRDTAGRPFDLATDVDARFTLLFFGYTNCPDICKTVMANLGAALTRLPDDVRDQVQLLFVTTDPARDDEAVLRRYMDGYTPDGYGPFEGLTGPLDDVIAAATGLHIAVEKGEKLPSGGYDVTHGTAILGVQDEQVPIVWSQETTPAQLAADIPSYLEG